MLLLLLSLSSSFALFLLLILSSRKASRAPQAEMAEEARVFERSEFPRRAISAEEHREPPQRGGECPAKAVLLPFAATKGRRAAKRRESSALDLAFCLLRSRSESRAFTSLRDASHFCLGKSSQNRQRRRKPALPVPCAPR
ncbi:hypothetical protein [Pseudoxanthomonas sp. GM95]|uniref:hypothetical protein n=1 Tax=Pseudoxanthomonas sp. GM95 TaxID=1881043 RepID=UPI001113BAAD|nr:hypothetical protein [Pseudoxanthomonas sp. GM95]